MGKPDLSKTLKKEVTTIRKHDGVYGPIKMKDTTTEMWSCCAKKEKDAPGCVVAHASRVKSIKK